MIAPTADRMKYIGRVISNAKEYFNGPERERMARMPFRPATFDYVDLNCLDNGVSQRALKDIWFNEKGKGRTSPLVP